MGLKTYYEDDADLSLIQNRRVAVIGYNAQAKAHAHNLRESGVEVVVGLAATGADNERETAAEDGFPVVEYAEAADWAHLVMVLEPEYEIADSFGREIAPHLEAGDALFFAHGEGVHFEMVTLPQEVTVGVVAFQGSGKRVRRQFEDGKGVPSFIAIAQDPDGTGEKLALSYAAALGGARAGVMVTSPAAIAVSEIFGQQAITTGGVEALLTNAFDTLVGAGYPPELAYFNCVHGLSAAAEQIATGGFTALHEAESRTAEAGGYLAGGRVVGEDALKRLAEVLGEIEDGTFVRRRADLAGSDDKLEKARAERAAHPVEKAGADMRALMSWVPQRRN